MNKKIKVASVAAVALASLVLSNVNLSNEISFKEVIDFQITKQRTLTENGECYFCLFTDKFVKNDQLAM